MRCTIFVLFVGLFAVILPVGGAISHQQERVSGTPQEKFSFAVLGDPHIRKDGGEQEPLERIIREINLLAPDFVVICGDLIHGPIMSDSLVYTAWGYFDSVMTRFQMPVYKVIGNHDVWDHRSEQIYKERYGKLYDSFSYKGSHFIVLDSQLQSAPYNITEEQVQWLRDDLEENSGALHKFVFLHVPVWQDDNAEDWWKVVHPLLAQHRVDAVFAGHWHVYQKDETKDGVKYIITSGAGPRSGEQKHTGHFPHFLLATVMPQEVKLAVVKPGNIELEDAVTVAGARSYVRPRHAARDAIGQIVLSQPPRFPALTDAMVPLANSLEEPLSLVLTWADIPEGWEVSPDSLRIHIPPQGTLQERFIVRVARAEDWKYPAPSLQGVFLLPDSSQVVVSRSAALAQAYLCEKRKAPRIDADLSDWPESSALVFDRKGQVDFFPEFTWGGPDDLSAKVFLGWDDESFYFATAVTDETFSQRFTGIETWHDDSLQLAFDTLNDSAFEWQSDDYEYAFALSPTGLDAMQWAPVQQDMISRIPLAVKRDHQTKTTMYEVSIPWSELRGVKAKAGTTLGFNFIVNDSDGGPRKGWIGWAPGIGESKAPYYYVDLVLKD